MANLSRSGRVTIPKTQEKMVIAGSLTGGRTAIYRFFNSGKTGDPVTIKEDGGTLSVPLEWKDSVDIPVKQKPIKIQAGASEAEVVYDFLGLD